MTSEGRFLGTALESTQKAVSLVQEQLGGQGGVLGGLLALTCSIRQKPSADSTSSGSLEPRLGRSPAMLPARFASGPGPPLSHRSPPPCGLAPPGHQRPLPQLGARLQVAESGLLWLWVSAAVPSPARSREPTRIDARRVAEQRAARLGWLRTAAAAAGARRAEGGVPGWE